MGRYTIKYQMLNSETGELIDSEIPSWKPSDYIIRAATLVQAVRAMESQVSKLLPDKSMIATVSFFYSSTPATGRISLTTGRVFTITEDASPRRGGAKKTAEEKKIEQQNLRNDKKLRMASGFGAVLSSDDAVPITATEHPAVERVVETVTVEPAVASVDVPAYAPPKPTAVPVAKPVTSHKTNGRAAPKPSSTPAHGAKKR